MTFYTLHNKLYNLWIQSIKECKKEWLQTYKDASDPLEDPFSLPWIDDECDFHLFNLLLFYYYIEKYYQIPEYTKFEFQRTMQSRNLNRDFAYYFQIGYPLVKTSSETFRFPVSSILPVCLFCHFLDMSVVVTETGITKTQISDGYKYRSASPAVLKDILTKLFSIPYFAYIPLSQKRLEENYAKNKFKELWDFMYLNAYITFEFHMDDIRDFLDITNSINLIDTPIKKNKTDSIMLNKILNCLILDSLFSQNLFSEIVLSHNELTECANIRNGKTSLSFWYDAALSMQRLPDSFIKHKAFDYYKKLLLQNIISDTDLKAIPFNNQSFSIFLAELFVTFSNNLNSLNLPEDYFLDFLSEQLDLDEFFLHDSINQCITYLENISKVKSHNIPKRRLTRFHDIRSQKTHGIIHEDFININYWVRAFYMPKENSDYVPWLTIYFIQNLFKH